MMMSWLRASQPLMRVCAAFVGLVVISILLSDKGHNTAPMGGNLIDYFPETRGDGSRLAWNHAVNSRSHLEDALKSKSMMLEADVSMDSRRETPIMAHPPSTDSDITLEAWLAEVVKHHKGVKLDFKSMDVLVPSLAILKKFETQIKVPLLLNADILPGPGNPLAAPLHPTKFIEMARTAFPNCILSIGWTTYVDSSVIDPVYDDEMVADMKRAVAEAGVSQQAMTFPVRACVAKNSVAQLQDLLAAFPGSTLTVWSSSGDPITSKDLLKFRSHFNLKSVYFDLPSPLKEEFLEGIAIA